MNVVRPGMIKGRIATKLDAEDPTKDQAIGRKNHRRRDLGLSGPSCPSSKILAASSLQLPGRMALHQGCPHQSWAVAIPKHETKAVKLNDC